METLFGLRAFHTPVMIRETRTTDSKGVQARNLLHFTDSSMEASFCVTCPQHDLIINLALVFV